ncbi:MAG: NAD(P)-dependent oxidoreductase [Bryobacterales bacterium]|nr:NAD(P)-dependent oxidoreductase [Bryobacterales bacterium]
MPRSSNGGGLLVTGSSGFIGSHASARFGGEGAGYLDRRLPGGVVPAVTTLAELADLEALRAHAAAAPVARLLHLAAEAEVLTPWNEVGGVLRSNEVGTYNLLTAYQPRLAVFASTSAAYGNASAEEARPAVETARPLGLYGVSKLMGEVLLRDWARGSGNAAVAFRLGNVVGPRCRGLIPYLVEHARKHPDGGKPARMRGYGKLVRDYVPVDYVVELFARALEETWPSGSFQLFNAGVGRGLSNGEVAELAAGVLAGHGWKLTIAWEDPVALGEAESVVLNMDSTLRRLGTVPPDEERVRHVIVESVRWQIEKGSG